MKQLNITGKDLIALGFPEGKAIGIVLQQINQHFSKKEADDVLDILRALLSNPDKYKADPVLKPVVKALLPQEPEFILLKKRGSGICNLWCRRN